MWESQNFCLPLSAVALCLTSWFDIFPRRRLLADIDFLTAVTLGNSCAHLPQAVASWSWVPALLIFEPGTLKPAVLWRVGEMAVH